MSWSMIIYYDIVMYISMKEGSLFVLICFSWSFLNHKIPCHTLGIVETCLMNRGVWKTNKLKDWNYVILLHLLWGYMFFVSQTFFHMFIYYTYLRCHGNHSYNEFCIFTKLCMKHSTFNIFSPYFNFQLQVYFMKLLILYNNHHFNRVNMFLIISKHSFKY
jgi:hypothetical protein